MAFFFGCSGKTLPTLIADLKKKDISPSLLQVCLLNWQRLHEIRKFYLKDWKMPPDSREPSEMFIKKPPPHLKLNLPELNTEIQETEVMFGVLKIGRAHV